MRRRLTAYFDRRDCRTPDDLADETLNRIARRLEEEASVMHGPPGRYCYIVAKFVFLEHLRRTRGEGGLEVALDSSLLASSAPAPDADGTRAADRRLSCLDRCLEGLPSPDRELILEYYGEGDRRTADRRRGLAARLGLTANALAIRACRIRGALEACVRSYEAEP